MAGSSIVQLWYCQLLWVENFIFMFIAPGTFASDFGLIDTPACSAFTATAIQADKNRFLFLWFSFFRRNGFFGKARKLVFHFHVVRSRKWLRGFLSGRLIRGHRFCCISSVLPLRGVTSSVYSQLNNKNFLTSPNTTPFHVHVLLDSRSKHDAMKVFNFFEMLNFHEQNLLNMFWWQRLIIEHFFRW